MNYETLVRLRTMPAEELADIALRMADKHPETFLELITVQTRVVFEVPFTKEKVTFTPAQVARFRSYGPDKKVTCIKEVRDITKIGLKEAKDLVETYFNKGYSFGPNDHLA